MVVSRRHPCSQCREKKPEPLYQEWGPDLGGGGEMHQGMHWGHWVMYIQWLCHHSSPYQVYLCFWKVKDRYVRAFPSLAGKRTLLYLASSIKIEHCPGSIAP